MKLTKAMAEKIFSAKDYEEAKRNAAEVGYELSAEEDAELKKTFTKELSDEELDAVAGGYSRYYVYDSQNFYFPTHHEYTVYIFTGDDVNQKYLCPNCGRPVHKGTLGLFYCDPCNESWFFEKKLEPNLENWKVHGGLSAPDADLGGSKLD